MDTNFFNGCSTLEEVKKRYRDLAKHFHPDKGGDLVTMQKINAEYDRIINSSRFEFKNEEEKQENFIYKDLINQLITLDGLIIEIIFRWVWVSGNTKTHKEELKKLGFFWSKDKQMWYWRPAGWSKVFHRSKPMAMDEIRARYGSQKMQGSEETKANGGKLKTAQ
jgi:hypothetical protein